MSNKQEKISPDSNLNLTKNEEISKMMNEMIQKELSTKISEIQKATNEKLENKITGLKNEINGLNSEIIGLETSNEKLERIKNYL